MSELIRRLLSALGVLGVGRHCGHGGAGAPPTAGAWQLVRGGARHRGAALVRPRLAPAPAPAQQLARLGVEAGHAGAGAGVGGGGVLQLVAPEHAAHHGRHDQRDHQHQRRHHHHRHHRKLSLYLRGEV